MNLLQVLINCYCIVSSGNGMVSTFNITNFSVFFLTKSAIFSNFFLKFFLIQASPDPGARKHPKRFENKVLTNFCWPWNIFSTF